MRELYQQELEDLKKQFQALFRQAIRAFESTRLALIGQDVRIAEAVIMEDSLINHQQMEIETACALLLARQQPVARDLRLVVSLMQMSADLEKIGDYCSHIAKSLTRIEGQTRSQSIESEIVDLADKLHFLLNEALMMCQTFQVDKADEIHALEDELVESRRLLSTHIRKEMDKSPDLVFSDSYYLSMALNMERIADYVTNICERIVYVETGQMVDHV